MISRDRMWERRTWKNAMSLSLHLDACFWQTLSCQDNIEAYKLRQTDRQTERNRQTGKQTDKLSKQLQPDQISGYSPYFCLKWYVSSKLVPLLLRALSLLCECVCASSHEHYRGEIQGSASLLVVLVKQQLSRQELLREKERERERGETVAKQSSRLIISYWLDFARIA